MSDLTKRFGFTRSLNLRWAVTARPVLLYLALGSVAFAQTTGTDALFDYPDTALIGTISGQLSLPVGDCRRICIERSGCVGFDHAMRNNDVCRLFSDIGLARQDSSTVAGTRVLIDGYKAPSNPPGPAPETECDRLAADPEDSSKLASVRGVDFRIAHRGLAACQQAVAKYPQEPRLQFQLGRAYESAENFEQARLHYSRAADAGYAGGYVGLGDMARDGLGESQDDRKAFELYRTATDKNDMGGILRLATRYFSGRGTKRNYEQAYQLFNRCADMGSAYCQYRIGLMYQKGNYVRKESSNALNHFKKSAESGEPNALLALSGIYGNGDGVTADHRLSSKYLMQAIRKGASAAESFIDQSSLPATIVRDIQAELKVLGIYDGQIDGKFGPATRRALMEIHGADL